MSPESPNPAPQFSEYLFERSRETTQVVAKVISVLAARHPETPGSLLCSNRILSHRATAAETSGHRIIKARLKANPLKLPSFEHLDCLPNVRVVRHILSWSTPIESRASFRFRDFDIRSHPDFSQRVIVGRIKLRSR